MYHSLSIVPVGALEEWLQPETQFPDIAVRLKAARVLEFELGEWLHQAQMGAAKRRESLEKQLLIGRRIDPQDVKVIFNPVRYVVFRGLNAETISAIELVDAPARTSLHEKIQDSIGKSSKAGNLEWATLRIDENGQVVRGR